MLYSHTCTRTLKRCWIMREVYLLFTRNHSTQLGEFILKLHSRIPKKKDVRNVWDLRWDVIDDVGPESAGWWGVHGISIQGTAHSTTWRHGSPRDRDWRVRAERERHAESPHHTTTAAAAACELTLLSTPHHTTYTPSILVLCIGFFLYSNKIIF